MNRVKKYNSLLNKYLPQVLIVSIILLVYLQNLWFDFAYLDDNLIVFAEYEKISSILKIPDVFFSGYLLDNYYRPMVMISFIIDTFIAGQSSMMYHLTNIVLHIIVSLLLYHLLIKLRIKKTISLIVALFYAIHPLNVNAVSWIVGRNDLIMTAFSMLSFLSFIASIETKKKVFYFSSLLTYFFAMLSKESAVLLPLIFILYLCFFRRYENSLLKIFKMILVYLIPAMLYFIVRKYVSSVVFKDEASLKFFIQHFYVVFEYIAKVFYFPAIEPLPIKNNLLIILGVILSLGIVIYFLKFTITSQNKKIFFFGISFFLLMVLPPLFVKVQADDGGFNYIDCRFYMPLIGFLLSLSILLQEFLVKVNKKIVLILSLLFLIYTLAFFFIANKSYRNGEALWETSIENHPNRAAYWIGYGFYFYDNKEFIKAAKCSERAIRLKPDIPEYYHKAALAYESTGDLVSANKFLEKVLYLEKSKEITSVILVKNYLLIGNPMKAIEIAENFLQLDISDNKQKSGLSSSISYYFAEARMYKDAVKFMKVAVLEDPKNSVYCNDLGVMYFKLELLDSAKIFFEKAVSLSPGNTDFQKNLNYVYP